MVQSAMNDKLQQGFEATKVQSFKNYEVTDRWRQGTWHEYFCDQTCLMDYIETNLRNVVAIAPCTEAKETPINDPYKNPGTYCGYWTIEKKEVDNNSNMG